MAKKIDTPTFHTAPFAKNFPDDGVFSYSQYDELKSYSSALLKNVHYCCLLASRSWENHCSSLIHRRASYQQVPGRIRWTRSRRCQPVASTLCFLGHCSTTLKGAHMAAN